MGGDDPVVLEVVLGTVGGQDQFLTFLLGGLGSCLPVLLGGLDQMVGVSIRSLEDTKETDKKHSSDGHDGKQARSMELQSRRRMCRFCFQQSVSF